MPREEVPSLQFDPTKLHHVAAKCGVFAETDIVNLVKSGIPRNEIMNSLADAIVSQNLAVLTRGNTLKSKVLLSAAPTPTCRSCSSAGACASPRRGTERGYEYDKRRADRGADLRPQEQRVLRRLRRGAVRHVRAGHRRPLPRPRRLKRSS
jgi:hypothetical protein